MLKIVTDSASDLPAEIARELDVTIVPLSVHFGERAYTDGQTIDSAAFYRMVPHEAAHPRTAAPPPGRFEEVFRALADQGHEVMAILLSSTFSGTYNSAVVAAQQVPEARVTLIDSRTASLGLGAMALRAARLAREGRATHEIEALIRAMIPRTHVFLVVDTLAYLQRGGRIGRARSLVGTMLNIKPILTIQDGEVVPLHRARTRGKAAQEIARLAVEQGPLEEVYVLHAAAPDLGEQLAGLIAPHYGGEVPVLPLGPVIGAHTGPGAAGVVALSRA